MKKELRRGNLVYGISDRIETVEEILSVYVETSINGGLKHYSNYEDIQPIPLTPEILLKCGARQLPHGYFIGKLKFTYEHNELSEFVRFHYSGKIAYIQYLHQLQNLYFALTNTELIYKP